jgi:parallel beta-helix repeat protein
MVNRSYGSGILGMIMAAAGATLFMALAEASPAAADLCGGVLVTNLRLEEDLSCPGDGLTVGADGITVNLNGHTIAGSGAGVGINVRGRRGVLVTGGMVRGFVTGVMIAGSSAIIVKENRITETREGIFLNGSSANTIKENVIWQNQLRGIMIRPNLSGAESTQNLVSENILIENPSGILVFGQSGNTLKENMITGSTEAGIDLTGPGASGNLVKENSLRSSAAGIKFSPGWTGNRIVENQIERNRCGLEGTADGNTVTENVFTANGSNRCP